MCQSRSKPSVRRPNRGLLARTVSCDILLGVWYRVMALTLYSLTKIGRMIEGNSASTSYDTPGDAKLMPMQPRFRSVKTNLSRVLNSACNHENIFKDRTEFVRIKWE